MPFSEDAEKALVCSLLTGGDKVAVELALGRECFYIPAHGIVWEVANDLVAEKRPTDYVVVKNRLESLDQLEEVGGKETLSELYGFVPTWQNFRYYAEIVRDKYRKRRAIIGTKGMLKRLDECGAEEWAEVRGDLEKGYAEIMDDRDDDDEITTKQITMEWYDALSTRKEWLARDGVGFGLPRVDERIGMQQPAEVVTIGAPTSTGKSMMAYQGMVHNMLKKRLVVGLVSLEMTASQTWDRLASHMQAVSMNRFRDGCFDDKDGTKLAAFYQQMLNEMPFYFYQSRRRDIEAIKSWARRTKARHGLRLLVVDYLQRVSVPTVMLRHSRQEQVAYVSNELKNLALELGVTVWCPVQLNKKDEVRESQAIEFDSDIAIRILLNTDSMSSGCIVFDKIRQAKIGHPIAINMAGGYQTIEEDAET